MLDYAPLQGGRIPPWWIQNNVFPRVVLCDFGDMAVDGDNPALLRRSNAFYNENQPNLWEDIYQVGRILRSLCMTHVKFPADVPEQPRPDIMKNESERWVHRPDSTRLTYANAHNPDPPYSNPAPYSDLLMRILKRFEWTDQDDTAIEADPDSIDLQPQIDFIEDLFRESEDQRNRLRSVPREEGYYDAMDVSWTRPFGPMPYVSEDVPWERPANPMDYSRDNHRWPRSRRRIRKAIRTDEFQQVGIDWISIKKSRSLVGPPMLRPYRLAALEDRDRSSSGSAASGSNP